MKKKKQYKMKTKHLITMMTILCLGLIVLSLSTSFSFAPMRNVLGYVIVPFQNGINEVGTWMTDQKKGFQSMKKLAAENEELQKQVDELQAKNTTLSQDQEELDRLRALYSLDTDYSEYDKVAAKPSKGKANQVFFELFIDIHRLCIIGFRFVHDLDIERFDKDTDFTVHRIHIRAVYQPFKTICHNGHLVVYAFEDDGSYAAFDDADFRLHQFHIFRADNHIDRVVRSEAFVHA